MELIGIMLWFVTVVLAFLTGLFVAKERQLPQSRYRSTAPLKGSLYQTMDASQHSGAVRPIIRTTVGATFARP